MCFQNVTTHPDQTNIFESKSYILYYVSYDYDMNLVFVSKENMEFTLHIDVSIIISQLCIYY